jgi:hypothetical protein
MAKEKQERHKSYGATLAVLMLIPLLGCVLLMPSSYVSKLLSKERSWTYDMVGNAEMKYYHEALETFSKEDITSLLGIAEEWGWGAAQETIGERVLAIWLWGTLITYRVHILMLWYIAGLGFLAGACCDGMLEWRIRQNQFRSQSPIRHYLGTRITMILLTAVLVWIIIPVPMPPWIGGIMLVGSAVGIWFWMANLQKRL